jgi:hypothetical protein
VDENFLYNKNPINIRQTGDCFITKVKNLKAKLLVNIKVILSVSKTYSLNPGHALNVHLCMHKFQLTKCENGISIMVPSGQVGSA